MTGRSTRKRARVVKLFRVGRHQIVRIPREFQLPGTAAFVIKNGDRLILEPVAKKDFIAALRALGPLPPADRFPPIGDAAPEPIDL